MSLRLPHKLGLLLLLTRLLMPTAAFCDEAKNWEDDDHSHDLARRAVARGEALPVAQIMQHLRKHISGDIVAMEYEYEFDQWVYEFKLVNAHGHLRRVHINATTGAFVNELD